MECVICKNGNTSEGFSTYTLERNNSIVIFKNVPSKICQNCGHAYFDEDTATKLYELAEETIARGVEVEIRTLKNAS